VLHERLEGVVRSQKGVLQQGGKHIRQLRPDEGRIGCFLVLAAHLPVYAILCISGGWLLEVSLSLKPPKRADSQVLLLFIFDELP
jgi:hypothetical protein